MCVYSSSVSSETALARAGEMSAHPSAWHLQSLLLSVRLYVLRSYSLGYTIQESKTLSPTLPSFKWLLSHTFSLGLYLPLWITPNHHLLSCSHFLFLIFSPYFFPPRLSGLTQTSITLMCPRTEQIICNFFFFFAVCVCVCVFCFVFYIKKKTIQCSECGCPLKISVLSCFLAE